ETIVLGGLLQEEDRRTRVTIPWIGDWPIIGSLLSSFKTQRVTTEVILTLTPHIVQAMTPPSLSKQVFWSGTDAVYSTSAMFTAHDKSSMNGRGKASGVTLERLGLLGDKRTDGKGDLVSLRRNLQIGPVVSISPKEIAVPKGKEFALAIKEEGLRSDKRKDFQLRYDPSILEFKTLANGEQISLDKSNAMSSSSGEAVITFRIASSDQRTVNGLRTVMATFLAKAPGVSPVVVTLTDGNGDPLTEPAFNGKGIVRVR
ncbi:hypothetical protein, partial [Petrachloros mirabilis]